MDVEDKKRLNEHTYLDFIKEAHETLILSLVLEYFHVWLPFPFPLQMKPHCFSLDYSNSSISVHILDMLDVSLPLNIPKQRYGCQD